MTHDLDRIVARTRRVRALHGDVAPRRPASPAQGHSRRAAWATGAVCSALCMLLPLGAGLRVRSALGHPAPVTRTAAVVESPLVRDALIRLLDVTPVARLSATMGTAEVAVWSPDGRYLAVGYSGGGLLVWDIARRRLVSRVAAHRRFVGALAWSPDGRLLVSASADGHAIVWHIDAGHIGVPVLTVRTARQHVPAVAFAPRGDALAVADGLHTVTVWHLSSLPKGVSPLLKGAQAGTSGLPSRTALSVPGRATALVWSPDGSRLAAGTVGGRVILWRRGQPARGWQRAATHALARTVWALAWAPRGNILAAGSADGTVSLLAGATLRVERVLAAPFHRTPVMQVPDYGAASAPKRKGKPRPASGAAVNTLAWSPDGDLLSVTATGVPLRLWRPASGAVVATYTPGWDQNAVAWRPDGTLAAVALDDGSVTLLSASEPPLLADALCRLGPRAWCAAVRRPLAPLSTAGRGAPPPSYMGR